MINILQSAQVNGFLHTYTHITTTQNEIIDYFYFHVPVNLPGTPSQSIAPTSKSIVLTAMAQISLGHSGTSRHPIIEYTFLCVWSLLFNIMSLKSIQVILFSSSASFVLPCGTSLYKCTGIFYPCFSVDGHMSCFQFECITNNANMNSRV